MLEEELISLTRSGNQEAFDEITRRYRPRLYSTALVMVHSHILAENAVNTTLQHIKNSLNEFNNESLFITWICKKLIRHIFNDHLAANAENKSPLPAEQ